MPRKGYRQTSEHIAARTKSQRGRKRGPMSEEQKAKLSLAMAGRRLSPEHRAKVILTLRSDARLGDTWVWPEDVRRRIGDSGRGKHNGPHAVLGECVYCGAPATTHDHVIPRTRGGSDSEENLVLACQPCNGSKADRTPTEWLEAMGG